MFTLMRTLIVSWMTKIFRKLPGQATNLIVAFLQLFHLLKHKSSLTIHGLSKYLIDLTLYKMPSLQILQPKPLRRQPQIRRKKGILMKEYWKVNSVLDL